MANSTVTLAVCSALAGCASPQTTTLNVAPNEFPSTARAIVWLWGADAQLADVGASLVRSYDEPANHWPISLDIPDKPHRLIDQGTGAVPSDRARFYFSVYIDRDGDGDLCPGDFRQNFNDSPLEFFRGSPPASLDIAVIPIESGRVCEPTTL